MINISYGSVDRKRETHFADDVTMIIRNNNRFSLTRAHTSENIPLIYFAPFCVSRARRPKPTRRTVYFLWLFRNTFVNYMRNVRILTVRARVLFPTVTVGAPRAHDIVAVKVPPSLFTCLFYYFIFFVSFVLKNKCVRFRVCSPDIMTSWQKKTNTRKYILNHEMQMHHILSSRKCHTSTNRLSQVVVTMAEFLTI